MIDFSKLNDTMKHHYYIKVELKIYYDSEGCHAYFLRDGKRDCEVIGLNVEDALNKICEKIQ